MKKPDLGTTYRVIDLGTGKSWRRSLDMPPKDIARTLYESSVPFALKEYVEMYGRHGELMCAASDLIQIVIAYRTLVLTHGTRKIDKQHGAEDL